MVAPLPQARLDEMTEDYTQTRGLSSLEWGLKNILSGIFNLAEKAPLA